MVLSIEEIAKHKDESSCWVIIKNEVYDVTEFLLRHPGGPAILLNYGGRDATSAYEPIHSSDAIQRNLSPSQCLGPLKSSDARDLELQEKQRGQTKDEIRVEHAMKQRPPLSRILSLADMEDVARKVLPFSTLSFFSTGSDDEITLQENVRAFERFFFHARVMRPVSKCDPSTKILGYDSSIPVFVSGASTARLGHPLGELNITRGCGNANIIQMVCTFASISKAEIAAAALPSQHLFFQLYKTTNLDSAAKLVREAEELGYKAIFLTVDVAVISTRSRDIKNPWIIEAEEGKTQYYTEGDPDETVNMFGTSTRHASRNYPLDADMSWEVTIPWLRSITKLPIILKGIQCVEDAVLAAEMGVDGILLSNHGGRQLEYSLPPLEVLNKLRRERPDIFYKLEVYIDGGIRRGTDVIKALCLGAKAVGLGRPFMYALSAYGEAGVSKILSILNREIVTAMQLLGAASIKDLTPELVERVDWEPATHRAKL
ncbi:FMN-dependent dehydrogenase-domain-containing protein [Rhodocollybia butyracea]|uniref:FMN-dependent dehydrogenase-domain-containing protein n=1 Tax=Rhodocollybia butyracea TaxID=206335 RepID=A0A9P5UCU4_9AGAR|nr:FMN-dependent dehydrogenase-domain-containing protein [Rhodocollybia butyracea]